MAIQVRAASGHDGLGFLGEQVIHDREVMRCEIPHHADVVLEQAEIDPALGAHADDAEHLDRETLVDMLEAMEPDAAADLLGEMPQHQRTALLEAMDEEEAED